MLNKALALLAPAILVGCGGSTPAAVPFVSAETPEKLATDLAAAFSLGDLDPSFSVIPPPTVDATYAGGFLTNISEDRQFIAGSTQVTASMATGEFTGEAGNVVLFKADAVSDPIDGSTKIINMTDITPFEGTLPAVGPVANGAGYYDLLFEGDVTGDLFFVGPGTYALRIGSEGKFTTSDTGEYLVGTALIEFSDGGAVLFNSSGYEGLLMMRAE